MARMHFDFRGKKALVTGASRGIGRGIVEALYRANIDKIYALSRSQASLDLLKSEFPCVETISVDLQDWDATRQALQNIEPVDFLINNAGTAIIQPLEEITEESLDMILNLNLKSVINVSQIMCQKMKDSRGGVIINVSSEVSMRPFPGQLTYAASKAALDAVTRQMAVELAPRIRVNSVNPTVVLTDLSRDFYSSKEGEALKEIIPLKRFAEMDEITGTILYLLSDGAGMVTGHCLPICGGYTNA